ncbi:MAG TPA: ribonuclease III [Woeseiaceae bacterium]
MGKTETDRATPDKAIPGLQSRLGYEFQDLTLLVQALTHRSATGSNNERLEFLGDAVLDVVISEVIFRQRQEASEGVMSRIRSSLVKDLTLVQLAGELQLGDYLILGSGEKRTGGHHRASIMADALEAIFGAVYLDSGFENARQVIHTVYGALLEDLPESASRRDPKTRLQEYLQARKIDLPGYAVHRVTGKAHRQSFEVQCTVEALEVSSIGHGMSRREAEQDAASRMLAVLGELP